MAREVLVTGLGVVTAFGHGMDALWEGLCSRRQVLGPSARMPEALRDVPVGEIPPIEIRDVARTAMARRIDRVSLTALAAARLALADAGISAVDDPVRTGIVLGSAFGNVGETVLFCERLHGRGVGNALVFPNLVLNAPLSYASIELGVTGPTAMVNERELSGETAIAHGASLVAEGHADVCLAGGADELDPVQVQVLVDTRGRTPGILPRAFDPASSGPVPGEGSGVLVLESRAHAEARGARVYARMVGRPAFGMPAPLFGWPTDGSVLRERLATDLADASAVVTSACGERARDRVLLEALVADAVACAPHLAAPQAAFGMFGAAGAVAAALAARAVHVGGVPPTPVAPPLAPEREAARCEAALVVGIARGGVGRVLRFDAV